MYTLWGVLYFDWVASVAQAARFMPTVYHFFPFVALAAALIWALTLKTQHRTEEEAYTNATCGCPLDFSSAIECPFMPVTGILTYNDLAISL